MFPEHENCIQLPNISNWDKYSLMESYLFKFITTVYKKVFLRQNVWNKFASPVAQITQLQRIHGNGCEHNI